MSNKILNWFFTDDADNHDMKQVVGLVAGAAVVAVGCFAAGWLVGLM